MGFMDIVFSVLENIDLVICMHLLNGRGLRMNWKDITFVLATFITLVLLSYSFLAHILTVIVLIMYTIIEFGFEKRKVIINIELVFIIMGVLELGCWCILNAVSFVFGGNWFPNTDVSCLVLNIMAFLTALLLFPHLKLEQFSNFMQQKIVLLQIVLFVIFCGFFGIVLRCWLTYHSPLSIEQYGVVIICLSLLLGVTYMWQKSNYKAREQEMQLQMHQMYDEGFQNLIADIRKRQHDFQNHLNTIYSMHYTCTSYEELVKEQQTYVDAIQTENRYYKMLSIGNPVIIGFLYGKFLQADQKCITVSYDIRIGDLQSKMPLHKMVEVIGNLFDNAVEAVENSGKEKRIYLEFVENPDRIVFKIRNASEYIPQEERIKLFEKGKSSKGQHRGIGLSNVKQICEQYKCDLQVKNQKKDNNMYLEFQMKIPCK